MGVKKFPLHGTRSFVIRTTAVSYKWGFCLENYIEGWDLHTIRYNRELTKLFIICILFVNNGELVSTVHIRRDETLVNFRELEFSVIFGTSIFGIVTTLS